MAPKQQMKVGAVKLPFRKQKKSKGLLSDPEVRAGFRIVLDATKKAWKTVTLIAAMLVIKSMVNLVIPVLLVWMDNAEDQEFQLWLLILVFALFRGINPAVDTIYTRLDFANIRIIEYGLIERVYAHLSNVLDETFDEHLPGERHEIRQTLYDLSYRMSEILTNVVGNSILAGIYLSATIVMGIDYLEWWMICALGVLLCGVKGLIKSANFFSLRLDVRREATRRTFARLRNGKRLRGARKLVYGFQQSKEEIMLASELVQKGVFTRALATNGWLVLAIFVGGTSAWYLTVIARDMPVIEAAVFVTYVWLTISMVGQLFSYMSLCYEMAPSCKKLNSYLALSQIKEGSREIRGPVQGYTLEGTQVTRQEKKTDEETGETTVTERDTYPNPIDLTLEGPGLVVLVGDSGAGKSTLMKLVGRELTPTTGVVKINTPVESVPVDETTIDSYSRWIHFLGQGTEDGDNAELMLGELVTSVIGGKLVIKDDQLETPLPEWSDTQAAAYQIALQMAELDPERISRQRMVSTLSGGQAQRGNIARMVYNLLTLEEESGLPVIQKRDGSWQFTIKGRLILADEPNASLDDETTKRIFNLFEDLARENLVLMALHKNLEMLPPSTKAIYISHQGVFETTLGDRPM